MTQDNIEVFHIEWQKYDVWYDQNPAIFQSELKAISKVIPSGAGLEIGVGTGRFASFFRIPFGIDPALSALHLSRKRNILAAQGKGESLPFKDHTFDFILIVATLCFVKDPWRVLREARKVLRNRGTLILAVLNKSSAYVRFLQNKASKSLFLRNAQFYGSSEILSFLHKTGFRVASTVQTLFRTPPEILECEEPQNGFEKGGFVVFKAVKDLSKNVRDG